MGKRLIFTGTESTGKTSMCTIMAAEFNLPFTLEFARAYLESRGSFYLESEVFRMAVGQHNDILDLSGKNKHILCDTDLLTYIVWKDFKYGMIDEEFIELFKSSIGHKYLLFSPDIPWSPDPLRENPNDRWAIHDRYLHYLNFFGLDYEIIEGEFQQRKEFCRKAIHKFLEL